ncbi:MAG: phage holin family protein [Xenococcus sp. MO_188.B8]|nr:phage holin family protein [Xenococcus sp. MO_188.B8]
MDSELIIQALNNACQDDNLNFQVVLRESILYIYINREVNSEIDYTQLVQNISDALKNLNISWEGFWLYSRVMGELEPDWQTYVEFQVDLSNSESDPLIEETEDLIKEAKESLQDLKYLKENDLLAVEELDDQVLDKDSFLLVTESAEEIDNSTGEIEEEELEDLFVVEELDDALLNKDSNLLALESVEEIENSTGEIGEPELNEPLVVEELDDAILNKNSFLLIMESTEEIDNSTEENEEEELRDLFTVEELAEKLPEESSNNPALESENLVDNFPANLEKNKQFLAEELDDKIPKNQSNNFEINSGKNTDNPEKLLSETINFSEYCFIRNPRLLNSNLVAPKLNIAHLVSFFHDCSQENKKLLLPLLNQHFKLQKAIPENDKEQFSLAIQQWLQRIKALNPEQTRKAAIWFSRYCFNPETTISEIQIVFDTEIAKQAAERQTAEQSASLDRNQNSGNSQSSNNLGLSTYTENKKYSNNYQSSNYLPSNNFANKQEIEQEEARSKLSGRSINPLVPIIWTMATLFFVVLGIISNNFNSVNSEGIPVICENITNAESATYCQLTVDLVGQQILEEASQEAIPFSSGKKDIALYYCEKNANIKAGIPSAEAAPINTSVIKSYGEEILTGIYFAEAEQHKFQEEGNNTVRVACIFVNQNPEESPVFLDSDIIPNNWPAEVYQRKTLIRRLQSFKQSLGIYSIFAVMGFGTLFTAIGLFVASMLDWGITIYSIEALYKSAFVLGILEVILAQIPVIGWFGSIALKTLTLGITSACLKGFKVNWSEGYPVVCLGAATILGIRAILNLSMLLLISALIA